MDTRLSAGLLGNGKSPLDNSAFTDLNRLNQFKVGGDSEQNIRKVAQEFESLFLNQMLKAMRSANEVFAEGNFMNSNESKTYQDMYDQQLAMTLSNNQHGIGLADVMARQMSQMKGAGSRPNPFAQVDAPVPSAPSKPLAKDHSRRDDSALLNQRRLALPSKLGSRLLAGIAPAAEAGAGQALAQADWVPAKSFAAPRDKALMLEGSDAVSDRGKSVFSSPQEFVAAMLPMAEKAAEKIGGVATQVAGLRTLVGYLESEAGRPAVARPLFVSSIATEPNAAAYAGLAQLDARELVAKRTGAE